VPGQRVCKYCPTVTLPIPLRNIHTYLLLREHLLTATSSILQVPILLLHQSDSETLDSVILTAWLDNDAVLPIDLP
jgi:hypothetical protein